MEISKSEAEKICQMFFDLVDAIYGSSYHHIGDGDGIEQVDAEAMREVLDKYKKEADRNYITIQWGEMKALIEELKKLKRVDVYAVSAYNCADDPDVELVIEGSINGDYVRWDDIADLIKKFEGETK